MSYYEYFELFYTVFNLMASIIRFHKLPKCGEELAASVSINFPNEVKRATKLYSVLSSLPARSFTRMRSCCYQTCTRRTQTRSMSQYHRSMEYSRRTRLLCRRLRRSLRVPSVSFVPCCFLRSASTSFTRSSATSCWNTPLSSSPPILPSSPPPCSFCNKP